MKPRAAVLSVSLALALLVAPLAADAQQLAKVYRIGVLTNAQPTAPGVGRSWEGFADGLREHGYIEGRNVLIERRWTEGRVERSSSLAAELVNLKVDLILAVGTPNAAAAKQASGALPIVMVYVLDPVGAGIVDSLAHPGGNITGVTFLAGPEIVGKHLELLKEAIPNASRVAVLSNPESADYARFSRETRAAGRALRLALQFYEVRDPHELKGAFAAMTKGRAAALYVLPHPFTFANAKTIADLATQSRLPGVFAFRESVEAGGLMAYAANAPDMFRRAAGYVGRIFKGAKPGDLPIEQPTKFELVINLKTAKALGLTIPQSVLVRADEVVE